MGVLPISSDGLSRIAPVSRLLMESANAPKSCCLRAGSCTAVAEQGGDATPLAGPPTRRGAALAPLPTLKDGFAVICS